MSTPGRLRGLRLTELFGVWVGAYLEASDVPGSTIDLWGGPSRGESGPLTGNPGTVSRSVLDLRLGISAEF